MPLFAAIQMVYLRAGLAGMRRWFVNPAHVAVSKPHVIPAVAAISARVVVMESERPGIKRWRRP